MKSRRVPLFLISVLLVFAVLFAGIVFLKKASRPSPVEAQLRSGNVLDVTFANYHDEVLDAAEDSGLPYEYLMALIVLETSGKKPPGSRFEPVVYRRLYALQRGQRRTLEVLRPDDISDASDGALRNLATSWGPFQLMGYKCVGLGVTVDDLRSDDGVEHGVKWIEEEYGHLLRKKRFKDAFHYHNTGRVYPKFGGPRTHDPRYVDRGLAYMEHFRKRREAAR